MSSYRRPLIDAPVFRDADGQVIEYGKRWEDSPPTDTYSVDTHLERFAPLHTVADALVAHLAETYDVRITEGPDVVGDLLRPSRPFVRAVRIEPNDPRCAGLTLVYTDYPGVFVHAGLLHDFFYPMCGCDACDKSRFEDADQSAANVAIIVPCALAGALLVGAITLLLRRRLLKTLQHRRCSMPVVSHSIALEDDR